ncbi:MAG: PQQ-binding-like beta-propeller repeat protein [Rubrivivax sp.]|nr:PQQ-binding-like beta-propeller repeat protein [Rubrivivax sp.]
MNRIARLASALCLAALAGCGGGGGGSSAQTEPAVAFSLDADTLSGSLEAGDELTLRITGRWTTNDAALVSVYLRVQDPGASFQLPAAATSSGAVAIDLPVRRTLTAGSHAGQLTVRACRDPGCLSPLPGSATVAYQLTVHAVLDWLTHQGGISHRGAVPVHLDPSKFRQVWSWQRPPSSEPIGGINPVVTHQGKVFVTSDVYFGEARLYALDESDGRERWVRSLGTVPAFNPPAVGGSKVYAAVTGHEATALYAFDVETGTYLHKSPFEAQWPHYLAATVDGDIVFQGGGYFGGTVYGFSTQDGRRAWSASLGGAWDMFSVAADAQHVYHHSGAALHILARDTGATVANIADPFGGAFNGYAYHGGPVVGTQGMVMSFAGEAYNGRASSSTEHFAQRPISAFDIARRQYAWTTNHAYLTAPAALDGFLYAARNEPAALDAIAEATGQVRWSFALPPAHGNRFHRNIVVTSTLLFCSTDTKVLAIDLASREVVWSQSTPGMLALSGGRTLYVATGARESDGRLVAVRLR